MKAKNIADIFPILSIDDDGLIVTKNADLCVAFAIDYPEVFVQSENSYETALDSLYQAVKNLGEGYMVHKQDFFIEDSYQPDYSYIQDNDFVLGQNEKNFQDRPFLNHKGYVYVILPASDPTKRASTASSLFKRMSVPKALVKGKTLSSFREKVKGFHSTVNQSRVMRVRKLDRNQIVGSRDTVGLLDEYFTLSFEDKNLYDISSQDGQFRVGNQASYTFVVNELDQYPQELQPIVSFRDYTTDRTRMPASYGLNFGLNLRVNHVYNQVLYIPKQQEMAARMQGEIKRHFAFSAYSRDNTFSVQQKTDFLDTLKGEATLAVLAHYNIQTFSNSSEQLEEQKDIVSAAIQSTGFISKVATTYGEQLFWSCIPGNTAELGNDMLATVFLDNAVALWNLETDYKQSPYQNSGILMTDRFGSPRLVDIFHQPMRDNLISNRNFVVVGPSGSGKSFTMNNMLYYLLSSRAHVTIVDIGHSYKRMGEIMGARYITHSESEPIRLNPFYFKVDEYGFDRGKVSELKEEFKQVITQVLFILFKKDGDTISKAEEVTIFNMVTEYYNYLDRHRNIRPCFNSFYEYAKDIYPEHFEKTGGRNGVEFDLDAFYYVLRPFYKGGQYDYLLNAEDDIDYSEEPFVIYELDNIKDHPILLPVVTLMITNTYVTKLFGLRGVLKILVIEEAWRAVSSDFFATFLLWAFKTARKHFGAIGVVTQEIEDLLKSPIIKDAIVQNTDVKILMDLSRYLQQAEDVLKLFKINQANLPQIFSINKSMVGNDRGPFRELALILGNTCKVYGVEVSKYGAALFTTEPTEVDEIKRLAAEKEISQKDAALEWAESQ
ncbi:TraG family conjugative transposon ATPase [Persicitalea jodogahamensis]|uniref:Transposase n=1 Tax=Persicitalea jodogahamensis TaxID=402147 RepID=A0A8J3GCX9_9BACT|nr:TraG family conjugative transposon ATPase [Persicitalea jodogahamensis]GHB87387.1 transposase [Persicitalea jodogahamensis]